MTANAVTPPDYPVESRSELDRGIIILPGSVVMVALALYLYGKTLPALAVLGAFGSMLIVTNPRLAVFQFLFIIFIQFRLFDSFPLYLTDLSAGLVIAAAMIDLLSDNRCPSRIPRLTLNFLILIAVLFVAGMAGSNPVKSINPMARLSVLMLTFLSVYRLSGKIGVDSLVKMFFWIAAVHSSIVLVQFFSAGGATRAWGFSPSTFNALSMTTVPVGLSLYLWHRGKHSLWYLIGTALVLGALISTQSRFSIIFALVMCVMVVIVSLNRSRKNGRQSNSFSVMVRRHCVVLMLSACGIVVLLFSAKPGLLASVSDRFIALINEPMGETVLLRVTLWSFAIQAFLSDPLTGIGPGTFRSVQELLPTLKLVRVSPWIRGLSAHNLFLHYLAEAGILGGLALIALMANQYHLARKVWQSACINQNVTGVTMALLATGTLFLVTTFLETGWLWGQSGLTFAFFIALIARAHQQRSQS